MICRKMESKAHFLSILSVVTLLGACQMVKNESHSAGSPTENQSAGSPPQAVEDMRRILIADKLADPDVLKVNDDLFFLSGTGAHAGSALPLYESHDLETFTFKRDYVPANVDKDYNYCDLWAPDLNLHDGVYTIYFSARRVAKGKPCDSKSGAEVATFFAKATGNDLDFGAPELVRPGQAGPHTVVTPGCPSDGCRNAIRIDAETANDGKSDWLFYVWFDKGNNISSFRLDDPSTVINNAGPAVFPIGADEEKINEGPNVFRRGSFYYLFFSSGWFNSQYAMNYIMADSIEKLTRAQGVHRFSKAVRNSQGKFVESHGHNSIVERHGEYYNFFHQGYFREDGTMAGRRTYRQRLHFEKDGTLASLNLVNLHWNTKPKSEYSLDIVTRSGEVIGPCLNAAILGKASSVTYNGICLSAGDRVINKDEIAAFRLYWSDDGKWGKNSKKLPYDGFSDEVQIDL